MSTRLALIAGFIVAAGTSLAQGGTVDAYVKAQPYDAEKIAKAAGVTVISHNSRSGETRIRLNEAKAQAIKSRLQELGFAFVKWEASPLGLYDPASYSSVQQKADREAAIRGAAGKKGAPGYLEARKQWLNVRTFPYDRIDINAVKKAADQAAAMPAYTALVAGTRAINKWEFVGAKELTPPATRTFYGNRKLSGRITCSAFDPVNSQIIYAGTGRGGLWKSANGGVNWTILSASWPSQNVNCILLTSSTTIYVGLGDFYGGSPYGAGIMKSTDAGATWQSIGTSTFGSMGVTCIQAVPNTSGQTLLATATSPGVPGDLYRSENGGSTWVKVSLSLGAKGMWTDVIVGQPGLFGVTPIFMCGNTGNAFPLHRSYDGGKNWTQLQIPGVSFDAASGLRISASVVNASRLYAMAPVIRKIFQSDDLGATWSDISAGIPDTTLNRTANYNFSQAGYNNYITVSQVYAKSPTFPYTFQWFDVVYAGNIDISAYSRAWSGWRTAGGPTWTAAALTHNDQHSLVVDPKNPNRMLAGNDGGLFLMSLNTSALGSFFPWTYTSLNSGLDTHLYYQADVHGTVANAFVGGTQDNGVHCSVGNPNQWAVVIGGDGGYSHFDPTDTNKQISSTQNLNMFYTNDNWVTSVSMAPTIASDETTPFIGVTEMDKSNSRFIFAGTNAVHLYDRQINSWSLKRGTLTTKGQFITALDTRSDQTELFVGTSDGFAWVTKNRGLPWRNLTGDLPVRSILGFGVPSGGSKTLVAVLGGTGNNQVMVTYDYTVASPVWVPRVGSGLTRLPNVTANCIYVDPADPANTWWVGSDLGVFVTTNGGGSWLNATVPLGLPAVQVNKLDMGPGGFLHAITYGRGIWKFKPRQQAFTDIVFSPGVGKRGGSGVTATVKWTQPLDAPQVFAIQLLTSLSGVTAPSYINVPAGATSALFVVNPKNASSTGAVGVKVTDPTGSWISKFLTIENPRVASLTLSPTEVRGTESVTGTLKLDSAAIAGENVFAYTATNLTGSPAAFTIPAGSTTAAITFSTTMPAHDVLGTLKVQNFTASVTIKRPRIKNLYVDKTSLVGGSGAFVNARIETDLNAGSGGVAYTISTDVPALTTVASTTVPSGSRFSPWFVVNAATVGSSQLGTLRATQYMATGAVQASMAANITVLPNGVMSLTFNPSTVVGGQPTTATITLFSKAATNSYPVPLSENSPYVTVPATAYFPSGATTLTVPITTTLPPNDVTVPITAGGSVSVTSNLTVKQNGIISATASPSTIKSGQTSTITVTLGRPAPTGGANVTVSIPGVSVISGPISVTVPAGATTKTFTVAGKTVNVPTDGFLTVMYLTTSKVVTVRVTPP